MEEKKLESSLPIHTSPPSKLGEDKVPLSFNPLFQSAPVTNNENLRQWKKHVNELPGGQVSAFHLDSTTGPEPPPPPYVPPAPKDLSQSIYGKDHPTMYLTISSAHSLRPPLDGSLPNPYVQVFTIAHDNTKVTLSRSEPAQQTLSPEWKYSVKIPFKNQSVKIVIKVWDDRRSDVDWFGDHVIEISDKLPKVFDGSLPLSHLARDEGSHKTHLESEGSVVVSWRIYSKSEQLEHGHPLKYRSQFAGLEITGKGPKKSDKIAIIGAGPAGIHMAHLLKKRGYKNVVVLEKETRVGGKSYTIKRDGVPHEMGTCFLHPLYFEPGRLLKEYGLEEYVPGNKETSDRDIWVEKEIPEKGWFKHKPIRREDYVYRYMEDLELAGYWLTSELLVKGALFQAIRRYKAIHREIFGHYHYTLPPKPPAQMMEKLKMNLGEFLKLHNVEALRPLFEVGFTIQGYGLIETIPAFYGLWWFKPELFYAYLPPPIGKNPRQTEMITMVKEGFQSLWENIHKKDELNVLLNCSVISVEREPDNITITYEMDNKTMEMDVDYIIPTGPLKKFMKILQNPTHKEKKIFSKLHKFILCTTLYESDPQPASTQVIEYRPHLVTPGHPGSVYAQRNSKRCITTKVAKKKPTGSELNSTGISDAQSKSLNNSNDLSNTNPKSPKTSKREGVGEKRVTRQTSSAAKSRKAQRSTDVPRSRSEHNDPIKKVNSRTSEESKSPKPNLRIETPKKTLGTTPENDDIVPQSPLSSSRVEGDPKKLSSSRKTKLSEDSKKKSSSSSKDVSSPDVPKKKQSTPKDISIDPKDQKPNNDMKKSSRSITPQREESSKKPSKSKEMSIPAEEKLDAPKKSPSKVPSPRVETGDTPKRSPSAPKDVSKDKKQSDDPLKKSSRPKGITSPRDETFKKPSNPKDITDSSSKKKPTKEDTNDNLDQAKKASRPKGVTPKPEKDESPPFVLDIVSSPETERKKNQREAFIGYQFLDAHESSSPEAFRDLFLKEMENRNVSNISIIEQCYWPYFYHFDQKQIDHHYPWKILEIQGQNRTLYAGASTCFESVNDVLNYNLMLVERFCSEEEQ